MTYRHTFSAGFKGGSRKTATLLNIRRVLTELGLDPAVIEIDGATRASNILGRDNVLASIKTAEAVRQMKETKDVKHLRRAYNPILEHLETDNLLIDVGANELETLLVWAEDIGLAEMYEDEGVEARVVIPTLLDSFDMAKAQDAIKAFTAVLPNATYVMAVYRIGDFKGSVEDFFAVEKDLKADQDHWLSNIGLKVVEIPGCPEFLLPLADKHRVIPLDAARGLEKAYDYMRENKALPTPDMPHYAFLKDGGYLTGEDDMYRLVKNEMIDDIKEIVTWRAQAREAIYDILPSEITAPVEPEGAEDETTEAA